MRGVHKERRALAHEVLPERAHHVAEAARGVLDLLVVEGIRPPLHALVVARARDAIHEEGHVARVAPQLGEHLPQQTASKRPRGIVQA